jgi:hypothetical protein
VPGYDSQAASEGRRCGDLPLTRAPAACQSIQCSGQGSGRSVTGLWRWTHANLERGEVPPEGASSPRARRSPTRGGIRPSSEAKFWCYGAGPLELGGVLLEGCRGRLLARPLVSSGP